MESTKVPPQKMERRKSVARYSFISRAPSLLHRVVGEEEVAEEKEEEELEVAEEEEGEEVGEVADVRAGQ